MKSGLVAYAKIALAMLVIDWVLGAGRFAFAPLAVPFVIVNFPIGFLFLWLERQSTQWWQGYFGLDDEIGQFIAFFGMILLQAGLIAFLYQRFLHGRKERPSGNSEAILTNNR